MKTRLGWGGVLGLSALVVGALWWSGQHLDAEEEGPLDHLALVLPLESTGEFSDLLLVYARRTESGSSRVEAVSGEGGRTLWTTEVAGLGLGANSGLRGAATSGGTAVLASHRSEENQMIGQLTALDLSDGRTLWQDTDIPEPCGGFWNRVHLQGDTLVAFCQTDGGHAIRVYEARSGEIRWEAIRPGEILETGPVFLTGMVFLPHPVHGRWFRLDKGLSGDLKTSRQIYVDGQTIIHSERDTGCASKYRMVRLNRAGLREDLACLPVESSPYRALGWSVNRLVGLDDTGGLVGRAGDTVWRLEFSDGFRHRGLYYEHKRSAPELSALHQLPGRYHPFILRKDTGGSEVLRLAIIDIETGALSWQSSPIEAGQEWLSRHILLVEDRFLIVVPGSEQTLLLVLDPTSGQFTDAVQLVADGAGMDSTVLSHHLLELHLYPERFRDGRLYGSARDQVFSLSLTDWTVHSYRGDPISVEISWKQAGELLGELPKRP